MRNEFFHPVTCPSCLARNTMASSADGDSVPPEDGDAGMCIVCGEFFIYDKMKARHPTHAEFIELQSNRLIKKMQRAFRFIAKQGS